jgi:hypothetical protein
MFKAAATNRKEKTTISPIHLQAAPHQQKVRK